MALARCQQCGPPKGGLIYANDHRPELHPNSDIVCGRMNCHNRGLIWLTPEEEKQYDDGLRVFGFYGDTVKVRLP